MKDLTPLLEQLASKLGTTVEMLWGVLLTQAMISGVVDLLIIIGLVVVAVFWTRLVIKKTTSPGRDPERGWELDADWGGEGKFCGWASVFLVSIFIAIIISANAETIVAAFVNPEYWALTKILKFIK